MKRFATLLVAAVMAVGMASQSNAQVVVFNSFGTNNFVATNTATGLVGVEDYQATNSISNLVSMRFVGGVGIAGEVLDFIFRDSGGTAVNGFAVALPSAGNFIWTITFGTGLGPIPQNGTVEMIFDTTRTQNQSIGTVGGTWFITNSDVAVGLSPGDPSGLGAGNNYAFELTNIPEPATASVLGLGLVGLVFRRRK